jgi:hypothetical protein
VIERVHELRQVTDPAEHVKQATGLLGQLQDSINDVSRSQGSRDGPATFVASETRTRAREGGHRRCRMV